jgi:hypothetical protein
MTDPIFRVRLRALQDECEALLGEALTTEQMSDVGLALQEKQEVILGRFREMGKLYRRRD